MTTELPEAATEPEMELEPKKIQGISIDPVVVNQKTADYPLEHQTAVRWLYGYARDREWTGEELSDAVGLNWTTIYRIWTGKYRNPETGKPIDLTSVCETINRYRKLAEARDAMNRLPFIETSVWHRVEKICREALEGQCFAFIYGESQIGKTCSLKEFARRNNHGQSRYVLTPCGGGRQGMIKAIGQSCRMSPKIASSVLLDRIVKCVDHTNLLIFDEIHEVFHSLHNKSVLQTFGMLRQLQEVTGCGIVVAGTNVWRTELEQGAFEQSLKQLRKRGIWELQLEDKPKDKDLALIAAHYRLGPPDAEAQSLISWINSEHGLGKYTKFLGRASQLATSRKVRMTWKHFCEIVAISEKVRHKPEKPEKGGKS